MRVKLLFATYFSTMLGIDSLEVDLPSGGSVGGAIDAFLDAHPELHEILKKRKTFLLGKFRAIYSVDGNAVQTDHILRDGDELKVLKAFIGG